MIKDKELERKNKIVLLILMVCVFISILGTLIWFNMYAQIILGQN